MSPRAAFVVLAAIFAFLLAGCGLEGQPFSTATDKTTSATTVEAPELEASVVTGEAIAQYPESSPEAAALGWWRSVQTRDPEGVIDSFTSDARDELPKQFPVALVSGIAPTAAQAAISVVDVETDGDDATVYVVLESGDPRLSGPLALPMTKVDGEWRITDPVFLASLADSYIEATRAAEESAADEEK